MDRKLKILFVNKFLYPKGGSETYIFNLADYMQQRENEIEYFGMEHPQNLAGNSLNLFLRNMDFRGKSIKRLLYPFKIIYSLEAKKKIRKLILAVKPDIIHLNNYNFQITPSILYEIKKHNIPVIMTLHDFQLVCPNHMMYVEHTKRVCEDCKGRKYSSCIRHRCIHNNRIKSILGAFEAFLYYKLHTYEKYIDYYISPSDFLKNKVIEHGERESRIIVLHNFANISDSVTAPNKKPYVLYFGRLSAEKGISTLLEACKRLPEITFVIAGSGKLSEQLADIKNIRYAGHKTGEELKALIKEALFSICPSEWYENCPMSVLESQMYGTPVIGADIGGIPELIEDGTDGLLFKAGDVNDLVEKINYLYNNEAILKQFSDKCSQKIKQNYSIDRYYEELMKVYTLAVQKH